MAKKFYVVWEGRAPGIYTDWTTCRKQVDKFAGAKYKSFPTLSEAKAAYAGSSTTTAENSRAKTPSAKRASGHSGVKTYSIAEVNAREEYSKIFTDGGCEPNPGEAGSGLALYRNNVLAELWYGLYQPLGTNNTAELNALYEAMLIGQNELAQDRTVAIFCDSKYSIQCVTQWAVGWQKKGWKKSGGDIKNLDLIKKMFALYLEIKDSVSILHVNGHVGVEGNELADRMSIVAISEKERKFLRYPGTDDIDTLLALRAG